jgi:alpha-amylase
MSHVLSVARLTGDPAVLDLALWLAQSDNLHLIQWFGRFGPEAEVSAYFTPREWWDIGPSGIIVEQQRVYDNVLRAIEAYLPARYAATRTRPGPHPAARKLEPIGIESRY